MRGNIFMRSEKMKLVLIAMLMGLGVCACSSNAGDEASSQVIGASPESLEDSQNVNDSGDNSNSDNNSSDNNSYNTNSDNSNADNNSDDTNSSNNANSSDNTKLYEEFLNGENKAYFSDKLIDSTTLKLLSEADYKESSLETLDSFSLDELSEAIRDEYGFALDSSSGYDSKSYAYVDFGNDGTKELVVSYQVGLIYTLYFVFSDSSDKVEITYGVDQGERWSTTCLDNGYVSQYGSSGAGDHSGFEGALDAHGIFHYFEDEQEVYYGWSVYDFSKADAFNEIINSWSEKYDYRQGEDICFGVSKIGDAEYYFYNITGVSDSITDDDINELKDMCASQNIDIIYYDDIYSIVAEYKKSIGMDQIAYDNGDDISFLNF